MTPQQAEFVALFFLVAVVGAAVVLDVWLYKVHGAPCTISRVCRRWIDRHPSIFLGLVFAAGVFVGHVWLPE
jgi:hypothetical protein